MKRLTRSSIIVMGIIGVNTCFAGSSNCASMLGDLFQHVGFSCEMYYKNPVFKLGIHQIDEYKQERKQQKFNRSFVIKPDENSFFYIDQTNNHFESEVLKASDREQINAFNRIAGDSALGIAVHHRTIEIYTELRNHALSSSQNVNIGFKLNY